MGRRRYVARPDSVGYGRPPMLSLTAPWHRLTAWTATRRSSFGTRWVQPENRVTRAIEHSVNAAAVAKEAIGASPSVAPEQKQTPPARPGQAA